MTRLVTELAGQAAVTQRAGRAARQGSGVAYRLWEEAATAGLPRFDPPQILEADLSALTLDCALWGVADPRVLHWIDPPPEAAIAEARTRLATLGALDAEGRRSEEHTSELQSLMRISYAVFCLKKKNKQHNINNDETQHSAQKQTHN